MAKSDKKKKITDPNALRKAAEESLPKEDFEGKVAVFEMDNELDDYVAFNLFHNLHAKLHYLLIAVFLLIIGGALAMSSGKTTTAIVFFVLAPIFPALLLLIQRMGVKSKLNGDFEFKKTSQRYELTEEQFFALTKCGKREAKAFIPYNQIMKVYEKKECFYFYVSKDNAFVVNKSSLIYGDLDKVSALLTEKMGKRYIVTVAQKRATKKGGKN